MSLIHPAAEANHLIVRVEVAALDQTFREAQRHGCVISPLARFQMKRTTSHHIMNGCKTALGAKLKCGAHSISNSEPKQATPCAM